MKHVFKTDFNRSFLTPRFLLSVFAMFLIWELNSKRFQIYDDVLYLFIHIWGRSITPLLAMVVTAFPYAGSYNEDTENNFLRYSLLRTSITKYICSKIIACFLSGFFVFVLGTTFFLLFKCFQTPLISQNSVSVANFKPYSCFGWLLPTHATAYIAVQIFLSGIYCAGTSTLSLALSSLLQSSYSVFTLPFLLHFFLFYLFSKISVQFPFLCVERIFDSSTATYTSNPFLLLAYAVFITFLIILTSWHILYKKLKGVFT